MCGSSENSYKSCEIVVLSDLRHVVTVGMSSRNMQVKERTFLGAAPCSEYGAKIQPFTGWEGGNLSVCGNRGTRELGLGEKNPQRSGADAEALCIFLQSSYRGWDLPHRYLCISRSSASCQNLGDWENNWMMNLTLLLVWLPPELYQWNLYHPDKKSAAAWNLWLWGKQKATSLHC